MPAVADTALPVSWRYVNGNILVRLDVVKVGRVVRLLVSGSGDQWAHYTFADRQALLTYYGGREACLQARGYTLAQTIYSRRDRPKRRDVRADEQHQPQENR